MPDRFVPTHNIDYRSKMVVVLGATGTGKTTAIKNVLRASERRALIISLDGKEWQGLPLTELKSAQDYGFLDIRVHIWDPARSLSVLKYFRNGIIVFDDCRAYIRATMSDELHRFLIMMRHSAVDIFAIAHGFTEVPPVFFTFSTDFILFKTLDSITRRRQYISNYKAVAAKVREVNAIAAGQKPHPKNYNGIGTDGKPLAGRKIADDHYCDTIKNE